MNITIIVGRTAYGMRKWNATPRVGDSIVVDSTEPLKPKVLRVLRVVWLRNEDACIDLYCRETNMSDLIEELASLHGLDHHPSGAFLAAAKAYLARAKAAEPSDETPADWPFGGDEWNPTDCKGDAERAAAYAHLENRVWIAAGGGRQETADAVLKEAQELLAGLGK